MKKRLLQFVQIIVIFLILGAMVNVGVAWGCVMWSVFPIYFDNEMRSTKAAWIAPVPPSWPDQADKIAGKRTFGITNYGASTIVSEYPISGDTFGRFDIWPASINHDDFPGYIHQKVWQAGWPMRSHYREWHWVETAMFVTWGGIDFTSRLQPMHMKQGILIPDRLTRYIRSSDVDDWYLPILPIWSGFIFNTLFYTVILWLPYEGLIILRRRRRIGRGLCGRCGYVVSVNVGVAGASLNCTECGMAIPEQIKPRSHGGTEG